MPTAKEIERKFLVEIPNSWGEFGKLLENMVDVKRISQTYLQKDKGEKQSPRVRKTISGVSGDNEVEFMYNKKQFIEKGVNKEYEKKITEKEYEKFLKDIDPDQETLEKTRFVFEYEGHNFELDLFKNKWKGLAILEVELKDLDEELKMPPFLKIEKEITGEAKFNNYNLASKTYWRDLLNK